MFQSLYAQKDKVIHQSTGVEIIFVEEPDMFPKSWMGSKINATTTPLPEAERDRTTTILNKALAKYPDQTLKTYLEKIYVLRSMSFYGQAYGGTNSSQTVYLTHSGNKSRFSEDYFEKLFHAEFSSILLRKHKPYFDKQAWKETNPEDFSYGISGVDALKNGNSSQQFSPEINRMGFLYPYATSTMENDFNAFAKHLFTGSPNLWRVHKQYPAIKKKMKLAINFYSAIDSTLNHDFFMDLTARNKK